jgi:hypothetical protein
MFPTTSLSSLISTTAGVASAATLGMSARFLGWSRSPLGFVVPLKYHCFLQALLPPSRLGGDPLAALATRQSLSDPVAFASALFQTLVSDSLLP